jgi:ribonuclease D
MITTKDTFLNALEELSKAECIAIDTEFSWEKTYYPILALVQISVNRDIHYLFDAPAIEDLSPLGQLLEDGNIVKILHDARQDLTILRQATGSYPQNVFDTRCAAGFAGMSSTLSLGDLIKNILGIELAKSATRTNWLRRPLTPRQLDYAIDDVRYLPELRKMLLSKIGNEVSMSYLKEEMNTFDNPQLYDDRDPTIQYRRIRGAKSLSSQNLIVLSELAKWREYEGRKEDRPVSWLVSDKTLVIIAKYKPESRDKFEEISRQFGENVHSYTESLLNAVAEGMKCPLNQSAINLDQKFNHRQNFKVEVERMLEKVEKKSEQYGIDSNLVASKVEVEAFLKDAATAHVHHPRLLCNWRKDFLTC